MTDAEPTASESGKTEQQTTTAPTADVKGTNAEASADATVEPTAATAAIAVKPEEKAEGGDTKIDDTPANGDDKSTEDNKDASKDKKTFQRKSNSKFDPSAALPESNDPVEIRKQVEFYFSDSNLPYDKFLWSMVTKENNPVPIKLVASFKRMKRFTDFENIVNALKESETLEVGGDPGDETIRRKVALDVNAKSDEKPPSVPKSDRSGTKPRVITDRAQSRSIYAKGFGEETGSTQIDVEKMFEPYGPLNAVRLRREEDGTFKGSVFIEFANDELQQKFMALDTMPTFNGVELEYKTKKEYVEGKAADIAAGKIKPKPAMRGRGNFFNAYKEEGSRGGRRDSKEGKNKSGDRGGRSGGRERGRRGRGNGRSRGRGDRRGGDRQDRNAEKKDLTNDKGVPQLQESNGAGANNDSAAAMDVDKKPEQREKRKAEDGPDGGARSPKKTKAEETAA